MHLSVKSAAGAYPVVVGPGVLAELDDLTRAASINGPPAVVSCAPVWRLHGDRLAGILDGQRPILIPDGERAKTLATVARLYTEFGRRRLDRVSAVLAFGGGVVGDVAGFAAATYLRGLRLIQVPTTLLGQVDSAIGGKVGVNLPGGKNLVGAFHPPVFVVCDPSLLATLSPREFRAGFFEVVKYGAMASRPLFDRLVAELPALLTQDAGVTAPIVAACCRLKAEVVARDEREAGHRRVLNFGHTIGHALEAVTRYRRFRHGEAIAYGMIAAGEISRRRGTLSAADFTRLKALIRAVGPLPPVRDLAVARALAAIRLDKKMERGRLHFVLARGLGATSIVTDVGDAELTRAMAAIGMKR